jgi:hypothetical protein
MVPPRKAEDKNSGSNVKKVKMITKNSPFIVSLFSFYRGLKIISYNKDL